jgi:3-oxoadipate enol-lactonase
MPTADIAGLTMHYRLDGPEDGPVLVLSNSLGTDLEMWQPQIGALDRRFRLLRYDGRGQGKTGVTPGPYSIDQLAGDLLGLLDFLGVERAHYCGLSMGGLIGQALALRAPERLDRLVLCNTAAVIGTPDLWEARIEAVTSGGMDAVASAVDRWFSAYFRQQFADRVAPFARMLRDTAPDGYIACCRAIQGHDLRGALSRIAVPTLVIAGVADVATPASDGRLLAGAIPGAAYVEVPAAHLSNVEAAEAFNTAILAFLNG